MKLTRYQIMSTGTLQAIETSDGDWVPFHEAEQLCGNLSLAEEGLANYAQEVAKLTNRIEDYRQLLRMTTTESEHLVREENERLRAALQKIAAYDPGTFRPLEDEIAIWRLATDALAACSGGPQSGS